MTRLAHLIPALAGGIILISTVAFAADEIREPAIPTESPGSKLSAEYELEETYVGDATVRRGPHVIGDLDENNILARLVLTPRVGIGILRFGVAYERFSFGSNGSWPVPDTLQAANLIVGLDTQLSDSILVRLEAQPGFYGTDDIEGDTINLPFVAGGTYIYSPDLQFVLGLGVDANRKYPILPGGGIRWKVARQWVLNFVMPTPRVEYEVKPSFILHAGAVMKDQTFRVADDFGTMGGKSELNHAVVTYAEVRTGLGFDWAITPAITLTAEAGYLPYREFDFFRTDIRYHQVNGAPYGTLLLHGAF